MPNPALSVRAQRYYQHFGVRTQVLPASLTSVRECLALAGASHITISPPLLRKLADMNAFPSLDGWLGEYPSLFDATTDVEGGEYEAPEERDWLGDEAGWRMAVTRSKEGRNEGKLVEAVDICCGFQVKLEELMGALGAVGSGRWWDELMDCVHSVLAKVHLISS